MFNVTRIPRQIRNIRRFRDIVQVLLNHGFDEALTRMGLMGWRSVRWLLRSRVGREEIPTARRFAAALQDLGPTFIKFGQILSARPDLLPPDWIAELAHLQDNVQPLSTEAVIEQIQTSLGQSVESLFQEFDRTPLATASIGQVHVAFLHGGRKVVVKVLRPGIEALIRNDVDIMGFLATGLERNFPELKAFRPTGVVEEFERAITREIDFRREARNAERFRRNFADDARIVIPEVIATHSSKEVLTLEFIEGAKVTDFAKFGNDPKVLASLGLEVIFSMAFVHGFIHADPHPGNIWTLPENRIALLDLGMADFVLPDTRDLIVDLMFATITEDPERIADTVIALAERPDEIDFPRFKRDLMQIFEDHVRGMPLKDISLADLIASCLDAAQRHRIVIPTDIALLLKALGTVEGVGKMLYPDLDLVSEARPYVLKVMTQRWGFGRVTKDIAGAATESYALAVSLPKRLSHLLDRAERGTLKSISRIEGLERAASRIESSGNRVALGMLVVALSVGSATLFDDPRLQFRGWPVFGIFGFAVAGMLGLWMVGSILSRNPRD